MTEKKVLESARNAFIAQLYDTLENEDNLFLVMEYCKGGTIRHLLEKIQKMSETRAK